MPNTKSSSLVRYAIGLAVASLAFGATAGPSVATATTAASDMASAQARYKQERQACMDGSSHQDRETCLKEARNALAEARKRPTSGTADEWRRNALARCEQVADADRRACEKMALGEGKVSGSVEGGGVIKEITTVTVGEPVLLVPVQPKR